MKTSLTIDVNVKVDLTENSVNLLRSLFAAAMPTGCCNPNPVAIEGVAAVEEARAIDKAAIDKAAIDKAAEEAKAKIAEEAKPKAFAEKKPAKPVEETKAAEAPAAPVESQPKIDIEDVRKALAEKVNDHRDAIKQKLTELGAPNVTKLDPAKYAEMYDFLKALKPLSF